MTTPEQAIANQVRNIEARYGRPFDAFVADVRARGGKHGELVAWLKSQGMGHGDANLVVHHARSAPPDASGEDPADAWYSGAKAGLRPIHDRVLAIVESFGPAEHAPKKTYLSLRRKKQFCTVGPATRTAVEIGFNRKGVPGDDRVSALPPGGMCTHRVRVSSVDEVDAAVVSWLRSAYDGAG